MKTETRNDLNEIWRMSLIILFWVSLYIMCKALVGLYANHKAHECIIETPDFIPSTENTNETQYAKNRSN